MHIHILGICGKFMSGIALIAKQMGYKVTGSDQNLVPSITSSLAAMDIEIQQGYEEYTHIQSADCVVIGNALSRGKPLIETILNQNIPYMSGPAWLAEHVLRYKWVLGVSGTHGKTTTTSMLTLILEEAGLNPGFMVGGQPNNFSASARYTDSNFFVIEADEYDTAFFDKRSKFLHYSPRTLIINNLEFDHADIFADLQDIKKQFKQLLRIIPAEGLIICPEADENVHSLFEKEHWTPHHTFGAKNARWTFRKISDDGSAFEVFHHEKQVGIVRWELLGDHNILNALAAIAAAYHVGILPAVAIQALNKFKGVQRRLELKGCINNIHIYDDFAHHPTAIATTLCALRSRVKKDRIFAVLEFGSNTMRSGYHQESIPTAFDDADTVILLRPSPQTWDVDALITQFKKPIKLFDSVGQIIEYLMQHSKSGDHILFMSNMNFDGVHQKLMEALSQ